MLYKEEIILHLLTYHIFMFFYQCLERPPIFERAFMRQDVNHYANLTLSTLLKQEHYQSGNSSLWKTPIDPAFKHETIRFQDLTIIIMSLD